MHHVLLSGLKKMIHDYLSSAIGKLVKTRKFFCAVQPAVAAGSVPLKPYIYPPDAFISDAPIERRQMRLRARKARHTRQAAA
jgi:hypothetical protein